MSVIGGWFITAGAAFYHLFPGDSGDVLWRWLLCWL